MLSQTFQQLFYLIVAPVVELLELPKQSGNSVKNIKTIVMSKNNNHFTQISAFLMVVLALFFINSTRAQSSGEALFTQHCKVCHKLTSDKGVGPGLGGINDKRSDEWLHDWINDSGALIASGDEAAKAIFEEFNEMPMLAFGEQLSDEDIDGILAYIDEVGSVTEEATSGATSASGNSAVSSLDENALLGIPLNQWLLGLFFLAVLVGLYLYRLSRVFKDFKLKNAIFDAPHSIKDYTAILAMFIAITGVVIYFLTYLLENNIGNLNNFFFAAFPYVALAIFLVGSIYRYTKKGYKVSSLSTQFLEGKTLFWGSQPFHWGLLFLFFGHLIAFLFPSSVIAWNGSPMRLLILEITAFVFALLALIGLLLLIYRRLSTRMILVVTNKMDMVVYTVLLTQILTGLGVAFFVRWGSSWFASVLTPYLSSIFAFNPDITAISVAPWWIQVHIISAFLLIAIIPFTRFMHFLVAPVDYIWRKYQLVIWNWNSRDIRQSTKHTYGKKPRNH